MLSTTRQAVSCDVPIQAVIKYQVLIFLVLVELLLFYHDYVRCYYKGDTAATAAVLL